MFHENCVPVIVTTIDKPDETGGVRFVNLRGLGIRDITAVAEGEFLIIAGPVGDGPGGYHLDAWTGLDCVPEENGASGYVEYHGEIDTATSDKAEGLTVLSNRNGEIELLVVFDGPERGNPKLFKLDRYLGISK